MAIHTRDVMIRENRIIIVLLAILTTIALGMVLYQAKVIILPFALAVFINYVLSPLITFFEKRRVPGAISILLTLLIAFVILNVVGMVIYTSFREFASTFPVYEVQFNALMDQIFRLMGVPRELLEKQQEALDKIGLLTQLQGFSLSGFILSTFGSILNFISNTFLVMLFLFFMLLGRNQLTRKVELAFRPDVSVKISQMVTNINRQIQKYLLAKTIISLITGIIATGILLYFDVQFAYVWGILTFLLNFIPNLGSIIATLLPLGFAFIQFNNWITLLWLGLLLTANQMLIGNFIDPRIVGRSVNLSPLVVLFSLIFWGWLWGIIGMFLAVPISVVIKIVFENIEDLRPISVLMSSK